MTREKIIIANWKMQLDVDSSVKLAKKIKSLLRLMRKKDRQVVICPGFLSIAGVAKVLKNSRLGLGAQDGFYEESGAFTGSVSMKNMKKIGVKYVILGHSERRALGETDANVNKKVLTALELGLTPIICVGETFEERKEGNRDLVLIHQVYEALRNVKLKKGQLIIFAYEPVWVIGSGQAIDGKEAERAGQVIRQSFIDSLGSASLKQLKVIYGGSVSPENIGEFTGLEDISGALVGGASLDAKTFVSIIKNA